MTTHVDELASLVGTELGLTDWVKVDQQRINLFADATGDHQWIHVDEARAAAGPFGGPIAHGYLTLSMLPIFLEPYMVFEGVSMQLNYGVERVRFPSPVLEGSRIRARVSLASAEEKDRGVLVAMGCVIEVEGQSKPACVAQALALLVRERPRLQR